MISDLDFPPFPVVGSASERETERERSDCNYNTLKYLTQRDEEKEAEREDERGEALKERKVSK